MKKTSLTVAAIAALTTDIFSFQDLKRQLETDFPKITFPISTIYTHLRRLSDKKQLTILKNEITGEREYKKPISLEESPMDTKIINKNKNLSVVMRVAKAVVEYPLPTFTTKDILSFLRSSEDTVNICDLTVLNYIGGTLLNRAITVFVGYKDGDRRIKVYGRGKGIVEVKEFYPDIVLSEIYQGDMPNLKSQISAPATKPVNFTDLQISEDEMGKCLLAYMSRMQEQLDAAVQDREALVLDQLQKQAIINELQQASSNHEILTAELTAKQSIIDDLENNIIHLKALIADSNQGIEEAREMIIPFLDKSMSEAPLIALIFKATDKLHSLQNLEGVNGKCIQLSKELKAAEEREQKLIDQRDALLNMQQKHIAEIADLKRIPMKSGKSVVLKSFSELGNIGKPN
ncbi:MAG: hypothetical protein WC823_03920 [Parcubacteria group bacterium]|jgi:hypothetical protein